MHITVRFLGTPRIKVNESNIDIRQKKLLALLLYLLYNTSCTREELISIFWCDLPEENARQNLRNSLHRLKKLVDEEVLCTSGNHVVSVHPDVTVHKDTDQLVSEDNGARLLDFDSYLFLDRLSLRDTLEFDKWAVSMRTAYERIAIERLESNMQDALRAGGHFAESYAKRILSLSPYHEGACRALMQCHINHGKYGEAIRQYKDFSRFLREELDILPEQQTRDLYDMALESRGFHAPVRQDRPVIPEHVAVSNGILREYQKFSASRNYLHCIIQGAMGVGKSQTMELFLQSLAPVDCPIIRLRFDTATADIPYYAISKILLSLSQQCGLNLPEPGYADFESLQLYHIISMDKVTSRLKTRKDHILLLLENMESIDRRSMDVIFTHLLDKCREQVMTIGEFCTNFSADHNVLARLNLLENVCLYPLYPLDKQQSISFLSQQIPQTEGQRVDCQEIWAHTGGVLILLEDVRDNIRANAADRYAMSDSTMSKLSELLAGLREDERECLELLSIFRNGVELQTLGAVSKKGTMEAASVIDRLYQRQLVMEERFESHLLARIRPEILRQAICRRISRLRSTELHRVTASHYEKRYRNSKKDYYFIRELHYHFEKAGNTYKQLHYAMQELWYRLDYCDEFFPTMKSAPELLESFYLSRNESYRQFAYFRDELDRLSDTLPSEQVWDLNMMYDYLHGRTLIRDSRSHEGIVFIQRLILSARQAGREDMLIKAYLEMVFHGLKTENEPLMREYIVKAREAPSFRLFDNEKGILLRLEALCDIMAGDYANAEHLLLCSIEVLQTPKLRGYSYVNIAAAYDYMGLIYRKQGEYARSAEYLEKAITLCNEKHVKKSLDLFYSDLGYTLFLAGDYGNARRIFAKSAEIYAMFDNYWMRSVGESCMAVICAREGQQEPALEYYRRADIYANKDRTREELEILRMAHKELTSRGIL